MSIDNIDETKTIAPIEVFRERCEARALLVQEGELDLVKAIGELVAQAPQYGLEPDAAQAIIDAAFRVDFELADNDRLDRDIQERDGDDTIARLAELNSLAYHQQRAEAAATLCVGVTSLDKIVNAKRAELTAAKEGLLFPHWAIEPADTPVETGILLDAIIGKIRRHIALSPDQALAVALWVMFTWIHEVAAVHSPLLLATSPEPNSGKSTLLGVVGFLVRRSLLTVSISGPALFRSIEKWQPTFIVDEADAIFTTNEDLKAVINSGWTRGESAIRCDPETNEPRCYSTFAPKAIGMLGAKLHRSTMTRSIVIQMKPRLRSEKVQDFDHLDNDELSGLRRQLARWANDHAAALRIAIAMPQSESPFENRTRANWMALFAIAELAGADWKRLALQAAGVIENVRATFESSIGIVLLEAIRAMFRPGVEELLSREIIVGLTGDPEQPWADYKRGKPITQKQLANLLRGYEIFSTTVHPKGRPAGKGYRLHQFADAFERQLGPSPGAGDFDPFKRSNATAAAETDENRSVPTVVANGSKNDDLSACHKGLNAWTDRDAEIRRSSSAASSVTRLFPGQVWRRAHSGVEALQYTKWRVCGDVGVLYAYFQIPDVNNPSKRKTIQRSLHTTDPELAASKASAMRQQMLDEARQRYARGVQR